MYKYKNIFYYYIGFAVVPILGIVQTKSLILELTSSNYAELQIVLVFFGWLTITSSMGLPQYISRFYDSNNKSIFLDSIKISFVMSFIISLIFFFIGDFDLVTILLMLVSANFSNYLVFVKTLIRVNDEHKLYNLITVIEKALHTFLLLVLLFLKPNNFFNYYLITIILTYLILIYFVSPKVKKYNLNFSSDDVNSKLDFNRIKQIFTYSFPVFFLILMGDFLPNLNKLSINYLYDELVLVKYTIAIFISSAFFQALYEPLCIYFHQKFINGFLDQKMKLRKLFREILIFYFLASAFLIFFLIVNKEFIYELLAKRQYSISSDSFSFFLISGFLIGVYRLTSIYFYYEKQTYILALIYTFIVILNSAIFFIVNKEGVFSLGIAYLISSFFLALISTFFFEKKYNFLHS